MRSNAVLYALYNENCLILSHQNNMEIKIIDLPKITDPRGNLTFAEAQTMVPFDIKRAYWVYDVPGGESRGGHAHKQLKQFVVALSGSFTVTLDDGHERQTVLLNHPCRVC